MYKIIIVNLSFIMYYFWPIIFCNDQMYILNSKLFFKIIKLINKFNIKCCRNLKLISLVIKIVEILLYVEEK